MSALLQYAPFAVALAIAGPATVRAIMRASHEISRLLRELQP